MTVELWTTRLVCKRREVRKLLGRQDRVGLQNRRSVNIIDITGFSNARDVYERRRPDDVLFTKSAAGPFILLMSRRLRR